uniref:VATC domain-containing protein n=1 Tax=Macrostomum lignano TaxID=282301 RepID=A0A1I8FS61_9PLAT
QILEFAPASTISTSAATHSRAGPGCPWSFACLHVYRLGTADAASIVRRRESRTAGSIESRAAVRIVSQSPRRIDSPPTRRRAASFGMSEGQFRAGLPVPSGVAKAEERNPSSIVYFGLLRLLSSRSMTERQRRRSVPSQPTGPSRISRINLPWPAPIRKLWNQVAGPSWRVRTEQCGASVSAKPLGQEMRHTAGTWPRQSSCGRTVAQACWSQGADPCQRGTWLGRTPYQLAVNNLSARRFDKFCRQTPGLATTTRRPGFPQPLTLNSWRLAALKRGGTLSDTQKMALAAERRLLAQAAASQQSAGGTNQKPLILSRCFQCAADITAKYRFHYDRYEFCSTNCLRRHRDKTAAETTASRRKQPSSTDAAVALGDQTLKDQLARQLGRPIISNTNWTSPLVADAAGSTFANSNSLQSYFCRRFHRRRRTATNELMRLKPAGRLLEFLRAAPRRRGNRARPARKSSSFARTSAEIHTTLTPRVSRSEATRWRRPAAGRGAALATEADIPPLDLSAHVRSRLKAANVCCFSAGDFDDCCAESGRTARAARGKQQPATRMKKRCCNSGAQPELEQLPERVTRRANRKTEEDLPAMEEQQQAAAGNSALGDHPRLKLPLRPPATTAATSNGYGKLNWPRDVTAELPQAAGLSRGTFTADQQPPRTFRRRPPPTTAASFPVLQFENARPLQPVADSNSSSSSRSLISLRHAKPRLPQHNRRNRSQQGSSSQSLNDDATRSGSQAPPALKIFFCSRPPPYRKRRFFAFDGIRRSQQQQADSGSEIGDDYRPFASLCPPNGATKKEAARAFAGLLSLSVL